VAGDGIIQPIEAVPPMFQIMLQNMQDISRQTMELPLMLQNLQDNCSLALHLPEYAALFA
jgi:hypothetical protein